jgi:hypothetical protein
MEATRISDVRIARQSGRIPTAQWSGLLPIGASDSPVFVLDDGRRIISRVGAADALMGCSDTGNLDLGTLQGYIPGDADNPWIEFVFPHGGNTTVQGITAETFINICTACVQAPDVGAFETARKRQIATRASTLLAEFAKLGLVALIDEVTGYQHERAGDALRLKLRQCLEDEMRYKDGMVASEAAPELESGSVPRPHGIRYYDTGANW